MIGTGLAEDCIVLATVKDALRRASARWPCGPSLTAAPRDAVRASGRDGGTALSRTEKHHSKKWPLNLLNLTHTTRSVLSTAKANQLAILDALRAALLAKPLHSPG